MKWRDLLLTLALLLVLAPWIQAQTQPVGSNFSGGSIGSPLKLPDGTAAAPGLAFTSSPTSGWASLNSRWTFISGGSVGLAYLNSTEIGLGNGAQFGWKSNTADSSGTIDTGLARGAAASVTLTNGTTGKAAFSTAGTSLGLAVPAGGIGMATASTASVGNTGQGARFVVVCGPTAGTASLLFYAGTTNTPVVLANAVGGGLIGC